MVAGKDAAEYDTDHKRELPAPDLGRQLMNVDSVANQPHGQVNLREDC